jgi:hypothetical protein
MILGDKPLIFEVVLSQGTRHVHAPIKVSVEVSNLSKGEICSNYSLSICPYVSTTIHRPT